MKEIPPQVQVAIELMTKARVYAGSAFAKQAVRADPAYWHQSHADYVAAILHAQLALYEIERQFCDQEPVDLEDVRGSVWVDPPLSKAAVQVGRWVLLASDGDEHARQSLEMSAHVSGSVSTMSAWEEIQHWASHRLDVASHSE